MFHDSPEGKTHYYGDGCGIHEHNPSPEIAKKPETNDHTFDIEGEIEAFKKLPKTVAKFKIRRKGCWEWQGSLSKGYGCCFYGGRNLGAHRVVYQLLKGEIPKGLQLDHLCRNPRCVRPSHLEPVTARINTLRGETVTAENVKKTHCPKGHMLAGENLRPVDMRRGWRQCRTCANYNKMLSSRRRMLKKAQARKLTRLAA